MKKGDEVKEYMNNNAHARMHAHTHTHTRTHTHSPGAVTWLSRYYALARFHLRGSTKRGLGLVGHDRLSVVH